MDGKETTPVLIGDVMIGIPLSEGTHKITFRYVNNAFTLGCIISVCALAAFTALCMIYYKPYRKWPNVYQKIKNFRIKNPFCSKGKYDK